MTSTVSQEPDAVISAPPPPHPLSEETRETVKATVPVLKENRMAIIQKFYNTLFERYPDYKKQFNLDRMVRGPGSDQPPKQVASLANMVMLYAQRIDDFPSLIPLIRPVCEKHVSRGVTGTQYDAIGECLLFAMSDILGDVFDDKIEQAWTDAYIALRNAFIQTEEQIRKEHELNAGWTGFRQVQVADIQQDDDGRTITLNASGVHCQPGMFVSIAVTIPDGESMASMKITQVTEEGILVRVDNGEEQATKALMALEVGSTATISVPCGKPKPQQS